MFKKSMAAVLSLLLFCGGCAGEDSRPSAESGVSGASQISESAASLPVLEVTVLDIGKAEKGRIEVELSGGGVGHNGT